MKSSVSLKNNTLYFDLGVLRAGDIDKLIKKTKKRIDQLQPPFYSISLLEKMIDSHTLLHPDDLSKFREFGAYLNEKGRALSIWVVPENSILYKTSLQTIPSGGKMVRVDTLLEAEGMVAELKKKN